MNSDRLRQLETAVLAELWAEGEMPEYRLLGRLREAGWSEFGAFTGDTLALFRQHFLLFHLLYRLRDRLRACREGEVQIDALAIGIAPYRGGQEGVAVADPLRTYYLDLAHLETTGQAEVDALLNGFWERFRASGERHEALALFGLCDPVEFGTVKRRYRQLVMQHHPDRGGDKNDLQELNRAMGVLKRAYGR